MSDLIIPTTDFNPFDDEQSEPPKVRIAEDLKRLVRGDGDETSETTSYPHADGRFEVSRKGVFDVRASKNGKEEKRTRVCDELRIEAGTRDANGGNWGKRLQWRDADGKLHTWAMPMALLQGDASEVVRELLSGGLRIVHGQHLRLREYLQTVEADARVRCVHRLGWHGSVYVTPDEVIGDTGGERIVFEGTASVSGECSQAGTVESWRDRVAVLAPRNSRLLFSVSCAFAAPLLELSGSESGGFHLVGASSSGKTTALYVAASVWGNPKRYVGSWRGTANGHEGQASVHNDGLLILDELSLCDPKQASECAYMLLNGQGKARASRSGGARQVVAWQLVLLSSGERSLSAEMAGVGKRANAGQEVRLANIPSDAGAGNGMFEDLHSHCKPALFTQALKDGLASNHGAVGREFLRRVVADRIHLQECLPDLIQQFVDDAVPAGASSQVQRVARRFGLVAAAGEIATLYGYTGWQQGDASSGVQKCFEAWLENFGLGIHEDKAICEKVRLYIEMRGSSRFQKLRRANGEKEQPLHIRAGFFEDVDDVRRYLVPAETFRSEVIAGFEQKRAVKALLDKGILVPAPDGRAYSKVRLPDLGPTNVYILIPQAEALD